MRVKIVSGHIPIKTLLHLNLKLTEKFASETEFEDVDGSIFKEHCYKTNNPKYVMFWSSSVPHGYPNIPEGAGVYMVKSNLKRGDL